jgi:hypothetical protein
VIEHHRTSAHGEEHGGYGATDIHAKPTPFLGTREANLIVVFRIPQGLVESPTREGEWIEIIRPFS